MNWKAFLMVLSLTAAFYLAAEFTIPATSKAPNIDGRIQPGEWQSALLLSGAGRQLDHRRTQVFLSWDNNFLYLAMRSELPPRGKPVTAKNALGPIMDDSLELWLAPPESSRNVENARFGQFQLIANAVGEVYLMHHNPGYGLPAKTWKANVKTANSIHDGVWDLEIAIPAASLGFQQLTAGDWKLLPVRNFRSRPGIQAPFTAENGFMNPKAYATFKLRQSAPGVHHDYSRSTPRLPGTIAIFNPTSSPALFTVDLHVGAQSYSHRLTVPGNGRGTADFSSVVPADRNTPLVFTVKDARGQVLFQRNFQYTPPPARIWFNPESFITLSHNFVKGLTELDLPDSGIKVAAKKQPALVSGRTQKHQAASFQPGDGLVYQGGKLPIPGTISMWVKSDGPVKQGYRRYFASTFRSSGYIGMQELGGTVCLFAHQFKGGNKNLLVYKPIPRGEWSHIAVNLYPNRMEYYLNGMKRGEIELGFSISPAALGDLVVGQSGSNGFTMDELTVYNRPLESTEIQALAQGESKLSGTIGWYPAQNWLVLDLACNLEQLKSKTLTLKVANAKNQSVFETAILLEKGYALPDRLQVIHQKIALQKRLPDGQYFASISLPNAENPLMEKMFLVKSYPWMNNELGRQELLLPPFTPVKVNGQTLSCLLRDYQLSGNGLPAQVIADRKPILAGPVRLLVEKNGQVHPQPAGQLQMTRQSDTAADYQAESIGQLLKLQVKGHLEFDGLLKLDLILSPIGDSLPDRVYLDIPVKKEFAKLFHAVGEHIRANPAGFPPAGQGTIWKSRSIPQISISNFIPYLWLGDDERGISYASDWDRGWVHTEQRDAVELFRHPNGDISIRLNLLNAPVKLEKNHLITIALMASPVKPMPSGWRGWSDGFGFQGTKVAKCLMSNPYWGSYTTWTGRYPAFEDFTYIKKLIETMNTGVIDQKFVDSWLQRLNHASKEEVPWLKTAGQSFAVRHTNSAFNIMKGLYPVREKTVPYFYTCNWTGAYELPEYPVFQDEWGSRVHVYRSYADYALYYLDKMLECGMKGIYNDNTFFAANYNWATGNAYIDEQGTVHPSLGLWRIRDYHKRQLTLMVQRGMEPWITVHHTNANILPTLSFATNTMGMEWKYGSQDFQERFTPDYIRAVCQGRQGGFFPTVLDGIIEKDPAKRTWCTRTMLAVLLPHEVRPTCPRQSDAALYRKIHDLLFNFGIDKPDCQYHAYWNPEVPVKPADPNLLVSTYRRGNRLLLVCGSFTGDHTARLAAKDKLKSARNAETGESLAIRDNTIIFPMKKHDFALIEAKLE